MKKIIFTRPDGGLSVCTPNQSLKLQNETDFDFAQRIAARDVPADATNVQIVDATEIPADRTFRNAWKAGIGCVEHDIPKCREIHKQCLRELRAPKLAALDVAYQRADEIWDTARKAAIAAEKKALRDVTDDPRIGAALTPDALKLVIPEILK